MWAALAALCLSACIIGGTGTDTENGMTNNSKNQDPNSLEGITARVTDSAGKPLAGVTLGLFDPAYRPDLGPAPEAVVANKPESLVSDTGGYVRLSLKAAGKYVVEGVSQGKTLFFDTLAVPDLQRSAIYTFRARAQFAFRGKVRLTSGLPSIRGACSSAGRDGWRRWIRRAGTIWDCFRPMRSAWPWGRASFPAR